MRLLSKKHYKLNKQIAVIGCGWFGLPLAKRLVSSGYRVKGTTTSTEKINTLQQEGIVPYLVQIDEHAVSETIEEVLNNCNTVIINIPPGLRKQPDKNYTAQMARLIPYIETSGVKQVLYISSTSVYEDEPHFPIITDKTMPNGKSNSANQLIKTELLFRNNTHFTTTVLRFSGLIGDDRHPAFSLSGKTNISNPLAPINLVHLTDCINISLHISEKQVWNEVFNIAHPFHPNKLDYYKLACKDFNIALPEFNTSTQSVGKIIDSSKMVQKLNYNNWTQL